MALFSLRSFIACNVSILLFLKDKFIISQLLFLICATVISGCTTTVKVRDLSVLTGIVEPLPATAGVYYSDDFRSYEHTQEV